MGLEQRGKGRDMLMLTDNRIRDINTHCLDQFNAHWDCLENNNHRLFECRGPEMKLNNCVFDKLVWLFLFLCLWCFCADCV